MSKLAKRQEQKKRAMENVFADGFEVIIESLRRNYDPVARLIAHISLSASAEVAIECVARQPTKLFSTKSPRLDKRRLRRYNRLHKIMLAKPNRQTGAAALIDAINSEIAL